VRHTIKSARVRARGEILSGTERASRLRDKGRGFCRRDVANKFHNSGESEAVIKQAEIKEPRRSQGEERFDTRSAQKRESVASAFRSAAAAAQCESFACVYCAAEP
jgi:hypothetical protein